ncbi:DNA adenine methylase [Candidatus Micrarchaeota archaeon]|nr:DNA adenine methylase [Candidatus Micrarchaeota archaeon]
MFEKEPKPFVKWAGGKRQLLDILLKNIPESFSNYHEPFVGGGALYFRLWSEGLIKKAHLNDYNPELMEAYRVIKSRPSELIEELKSTKYRNESETYYGIRAETPRDSIEKVARFLYLNKTAFNGLYRVNSKGGFNVPFGKYKNPKICNEENIMLVSEALKKATLFNDDFSIVLKYAKPKDFAYFDPPYYPISKTSSFTNYTKLDFTEEDQRRLQSVYSQLDKKDIHVMLSNSAAPFITELYSNYNTVGVMARRAINCKADKRGPVPEIVALNY